MRTVVRGHAIVPWAWPGWATGGTTTLSFALGFSEDAVPYIAIGALVLIGAVLTVSPVVGAVRGGSRAG